MSEATAPTTITMTSTPIKPKLDQSNGLGNLNYSANTENIKPSANSNAPAGKSVAYNSLHANNMDSKKVPKQQTIAPSPNKPVPIAAKPIQASTAAAYNNQPVQQNILSGAQLQQQQQQYIMQQQFQHQMAAYQRQQQQQQQAMYMNAGNIRMANANTGNNQQNINTQLILAALKQQQQQQSQQQKTQNQGNPNTSINMNNPSQLTLPSAQQQQQQLLQYLANQKTPLNIQDAAKLTNQQAIPTNEKNSKNLVPRPDQVQPKQKSVPITSKKQANATNNQVSSTSIAAPTIYAATTNANGQLVFQTVEPSAVTAAALAAYQQQHQNQQKQQMHQQQQHQQPQSQPQSQPQPPQPPQQQLSSQKLPLPSNNYFPQTNNKTIASVLNNNNISNAHNSQSLTQQELLKQKLMQEELKHKQLQQKLNMLNNKLVPDQTNENITYPSEKSPSSNNNALPISNSTDKSNNHSNIMPKRLSPKLLPKTQDIEKAHNLSMTDNRTLNDSAHRKSIHSNNASMNKSLTNSNKRRGRPRLYEVNPITGKSMKNKLLANKDTKTNAPATVAVAEPKAQLTNDDLSQIIFRPTVNSLPTQIMSNNNNLAMYPSPASSTNNFVKSELPNDNSMIVETVKSGEELIDIDVDNQKVEQNIETHNLSDTQSYSSESESESHTSDVTEVIQESEANNQKEPEITNEIVYHANTNSSSVEMKTPIRKEIAEVIRFNKATRDSIEDAIEAVINQNQSFSDHENSQDQKSQNNSTHEIVHSSIHVPNDLKMSSPASPPISHSSSSSSKSSRSSSSSSLNSSMKKRNNRMLLENTRNMTTIPPGVHEDVILTHIIEGYVIKESSKPFPVKQPSEEGKQKPVKKMVDIDDDEFHARLEQIQNNRKKLLEDLQKSINESDNNECDYNSPPKLTPVPFISPNSEGFKCIVCQTKEQGYSNENKFMSDKYCSQTCMQAHSQSLQTTWPVSDSILNVSSHTTLNASKKLRKSVENEKPIRQNLSHHLEDTTNTVVNNACQNRSTNHHATSPARDFVYKKPVCQNNFETIDRMDTSCPPPGIKDLAISTSPKNQQNQSLNPFNLSKNTFESELPPGDPCEWTDDDVCQFVKLVAGVTYAEMFKMQEVDGSALSLIRDDHLVNTMGIKLGPALKIMNKFNEIKNRFHETMTQ